MLISRQTTDPSGAQYLKIGEGWLRAMQQAGLAIASRNGIINGFLIQVKKLNEQATVRVICPTSLAMCCYIGADEKLHFAAIPASGATLAAMVDVLLGGDGTIDPVADPGGTFATIGTATLVDTVGDLDAIVSTASAPVPSATRYDHPLITATTNNVWLSGYSPAMMSPGARAFLPLSYSITAPADPDLSNAVQASYRLGYTWWLYDAFLSGPSPFFMGKVYSRVNATIAISELATRT